MLGDSSACKATSILRSLLDLLVVNIGFRRKPWNWLSTVVGKQFLHVFLDERGAGAKDDDGASRRFRVFFPHDERSMASWRGFGMATRVAWQRSR